MKNIYYTRIFGALMTIEPMYYDAKNPIPSVFVVADLQNDNVQFARIPINAIASDKNRFNKATNLSTQRLKRHFLARVADADDFFDNAPDMTKIAEIPTLPKIAELLDKQIIVPK